MALEIQPDFVPALINCGGARVQNSEYHEDIADFTEVVLLKPDFPHVCINHGCAWAELEIFDKAIADFEKALKVNPDFTTATKCLKQARAARKEEITHALAEMREAPCKH